MLPENSTITELRLPGMVEETYEAQPGIPVLLRLKVGSARMRGRI